jgi:MFS family permease
MSGTVVSARLDPAARSRTAGAARANLAGALGQVLAVYGAPGSVLLTLFLQERLHAAKWQIGLVLTMTYLGPTLEPVGAYLAERCGRRRPLFLIAFLFNRLPFFLLTVIPFLGQSEKRDELGITLVFALVAFTRVAAHLGNPAWWSWMADLVPERRRGQFFGCRTKWASFAAAVSFVLGMALLQTCGGMHSSWVLSVLFGIGALAGTLDILLYLGVPEPTSPRLAPAAQPGFLTFSRSFLRPFCQPSYRRLIVGMGLWSFSSNLVLPFLPVYQRGEVIAGHPLGLGASWSFMALLNVLGSVGGALTSRRWAVWGGRLGQQWLLLLGSGYLFVNLAYLLVAPHHGLALLLPVALVSGALNAAWTVGANQLFLGVAPRESRSYYISAYNLTNGWLMAGGPLLGGLLADRLPVLSWGLPGGLPFCYFHLLLIAATVGGALALIVLAKLEAPGRSASEGTPRRSQHRFRARFRLGVVNQEQNRHRDNLVGEPLA